jgi:hypothetical protein
LERGGWLVWAIVLAVIQVIETTGGMLFISLLRGAGSRPMYCAQLTHTYTQSRQLAEIQRFFHKQAHTPSSRIFLLLLNRYLVRALLAESSTG